MESSQKIGQKIWKISQITSKCHVATNGTNGSGDKNLPNNERGRERADWANMVEEWAILGKYGVLSRGMGVGGGARGG